LIRTLGSASRAALCGALLSGALLVTGCASGPVPVAHVTSAKAAIRLAHQVGAVDTPRAAKHLRLARDQFAQAQRLLRRDENHLARLALLRAEADADFAVALALEEKIRARALRTLPVPFPGPAVGSGG
jgi:hypothetical protein